jgi:tetratricopeptide (TPR) repeat protein
MSGRRRPLARATLVRAAVVPGLAVLAVAALLFSAAAAQAQIPDEFTNLEVLPDDIGQRELVGVMRGFAGALGVRCTHCHLGDTPGSLEGVDFATDELETKRVARAMMQMVKEINGSLIPTTGRDNPLEVKCITCHHGIAKPQTLQDALSAAYDEGGADAAVAEYRQLRDRYYGSAAYDFGIGTLANVAQTLAQGRQDLDGALTIARLNLEFFPESARAHFLEGQILVAKGDREAGIRSMERAVELDPENNFFQRALNQAKGGGN